MNPSLCTRGWLPLLGCGLAAGGMAGAASLAGRHPLMPAGAAAAEVEVAIAIDNFAFTPPMISVAAGTRIVWTSRDDCPHNIVSAEDPRVLRSSVLDTGDRFSFTFATPGTYRYFCSLHPHKQATVVVR